MIAGVVRPRGRRGLLLLLGNVGAVQLHPPPGDGLLIGTVLGPKKPATIWNGPHICVRLDGLGKVGRCPNRNLFDILYTDKAQKGNGSEGGRKNRRRVSMKNSRITRVEEWTSGILSQTQTLLQIARAAAKPTGALTK